MNKEKQILRRLAVFFLTVLITAGMSACSTEPYELVGNLYETDITVVHNSEPATSERNEEEENKAENSVTASGTSDSDTLQESEPADQGTQTDENGLISVTMLDVGNGLSILINADEHCMLVDGGGRDTSRFVVAYLKSHGITSLDYMIATHYDEDHIAGLVGVLNTTEVEQVIRPDYETDTKIYASFMEKLSENGAETVYPSVGDEYALGGAAFTVLAPAALDETYENNNSVAIRITYGNFSCIITGDAEFESEEIMVQTFGGNLQSDLYVAGHHGSNNASSAEFLQAVQPEYVFISCGADNQYGHPAEGTMERLKNIGAEIFRTDLQGTVTAYSDGTNMTFDQEPCNDFTPGSAEE